MKRNNRLVVVSNRLPVTLDDGNDGIEIQPSCGGLVSALLPVFTEMGGCWVGWPGTADCKTEIADYLRAGCGPEYSLEPVSLTAKERALFYHGCANEIIWPLFHDLQSRCRFDPSFWHTYCSVNAKFADAVQSVTSQSDSVWVHDYQLMMVGKILRDRDVSMRPAYFHHVPFPSPDIFEKLPWRKDIIRALLSYGTIGFQTDRDRRNFVACAKREIATLRLRRSGELYEVETPEGRTLVGTFPISIDYESFSHSAAKEEVSAICREITRSCDGRKIVLGVDRLDYTKGIPERLLGFAAFLKKHPELRREVALVQLVVPSREEIQNYSDLRELIERRISEINGEFGSPGYSPVTYMHKSLSREELLGLYRAADVMLVTPVKDGMNLVAKEYCASRNDEKGVLVLSEFAGAAAELGHGALLVNPYDSEAISEAISTALAMNPSSASRRMRLMRRVIKSNDVFTWSEKFLSATSRTNLLDIHSQGLVEDHEPRGLAAGSACN